MMEKYKNLQKERPQNESESERESTNNIVLILIISNREHILDPSVRFRFNGRSHVPSSQVI